jgi:hypothetical protein
MDILGQILWFSMFATPLITIPLAWKFIKEKKAVRLIIGILFAAMLSLFLYIISLGILLRNGLGPV